MQNSDQKATNGKAKRLPALGALVSGVATTSEWTRMVVPCSAVRPGASIVVEYDSAQLRVGAVSLTTQDGSSVRASARGAAYVVPDGVSAMAVCFDVQAVVPVVRDRASVRVRDSEAFEAHLVLAVEGHTAWSLLAREWDQTADGVTLVLDVFNNGDVVLRDVEVIVLAPGFFEVLSGSPGWKTVTIMRDGEMQGGWAYAVPTLEAGAMQSVTVPLVGYDASDEPSLDCALVHRDDRRVFFGQGEWESLALPSVLPQTDASSVEVTLCGGGFFGVMSRYVVSCAAREDLDASTVKVVSGKVEIGTIELPPMVRGSATSTIIESRSWGMETAAMWTDVAGLTIAVFENRERLLDGGTISPRRADLRSIVSGDSEQSPTVTIEVANIGSEYISDAIVRIDSVPGVAAVVDSLEIDGRARMSVDGSVPVFGEGVELPSISPGQTVMVSFRVRSLRPGESLLQVHCLGCTSSLRVAIAQGVGEYEATESAAAPVVVALSAIAPIAPGVEPRRSPARSTPEISAQGRLFASTGVLGAQVLALWDLLPDTKAYAEVRSVVSAILDRYAVGAGAGMFGASGVSLETEELTSAVSKLARNRKESVRVHPFGATLYVIGCVPKSLWRDAVIARVEQASIDDDLLVSWESEGALS